MSVESYLCSICGKTQKTLASLKKHQSLHAGFKLCCEYCGKILASKRALVSHLVTFHDEGVDKAFVCGFCGKHFKRKTTWNVHLNSHNGIKPFHCTVCVKSFTQKKSLDLHLQIHNGGDRTSKQNCSNGVNSRKHGVQQHSSDAEGSIIPEDSPEQPNTLQSDNVNGETAVHQTKRQPIIDANFKCHSSSKKLPSQTCQKEFSDLENLVTHQSSRSTVESTRHICTLCQKTFSQKSKLMRHLKLHLEEPQFRCNVCSRRYYRRDNLVNHSKKHLRTDSELACHICEKKFSESVALKKHMDHHMHPKHSCLLCVKTFSTQAALRYHNAAHNGDSKYTCSNCGKTFIRKCHYDSHKIIHEKNFIKCNVCFKQFNGQVYYKRHLKRAHSDEAK